MPNFGPTDPQFHGCILPHKIPPASETDLFSNVDSFSAVNATAITTTTLQEIKGGTAGKKMWVTQAIAVNYTTTEDQVVILHDEDDVFRAVLPCQDPDALTAPAQFQNFNPPLEFAANKGIEAIGLIALKGDVHVFINGYIEN